MRNLPATVRTSARALHQELEGAVVILDGESGKYFRLDAVGSQLWRFLCVENLSPETTLTRLQALYAAPPEVLQRDVIAFLERLQAAGLIEVESVA